MERTLTGEDLDGASSLNLPVQDPGLPLNIALILFFCVDPSRASWRKHLHSSLHPISGRFLGAGKTRSLGPKPNSACSWPEGIRKALLFTLGGSPTPGSPGECWNGWGRGSPGVQWSSSIHMRGTCLCARPTAEGQWSPSGGGSCS